MADDDKKEETAPLRRLVNIYVKPKEGVDAKTLHEKIVKEVVSQPQYKMKWDPTVKIEGGKIYSSFTINEEADFFEEVMDPIECYWDEVEGHDIVFQTVME